jgi:hypothetical protein
MDRNQRNSNSSSSAGADRDSMNAADRQSDPIQDRLLDDREESQENIVDAARQSFTQDQKDAEHPSRVERSASDVEDPSHSKGSGSQR